LLTNMVSFFGLLLKGYGFVYKTTQHELTHVGYQYQCKLTHVRSTERELTYVGVRCFYGQIFLWCLGKFNMTQDIQ